jgi:hypothetical protein
MSEPVCPQRCRNDCFSRKISEPTPMHRIRVILYLTVLIAFATAAAFAEQMSTLNFVVLKEASGKPIRNASIVLHPVKKDGKQSKGGLQLKTDPEGKTNYSGVPYGKLRVQVIAPGYQTFGEDFEISKPEQEIVIKMQRPKDQYSIYK